ncbi:hypothetical protein V2J09_017257 [Rumex salicifolius]
MSVFAQPAGAFKPSSPFPFWVSRLELQPYHSSCGPPFGRYLFKRSIQFKGHKSSVSARPYSDNVTYIDGVQPCPYYGPKRIFQSPAQYSYENYGRRTTRVGSYNGKIYNQSINGALPSEILPKSTKNNWRSAGESGRGSVTMTSILKSGGYTDMASQSRKEDVPDVPQISGNGDMECNSIFSNGLSCLELSGSDKKLTNRLSSNVHCDSKTMGAQKGFEFSKDSGISSRSTRDVANRLSMAIDVPSTVKQASVVEENGATRISNSTQNASLLATKLLPVKQKELSEITTNFEAINELDKVLLPEKESPIEQQRKLRSELCRIYDKVLIVDNIPDAKKVVKILTTQFRHLVHACDTEVSKIDVKQETPVDHGEITCFSIYCGEEADFGNGKSCVWVDVLDGGGKGLLVEFAPFFEDLSIKKVWHNYSFDCHVIENYGIKLAGFHADTMHMARLWDSSRRLEGGYSLEALTSDPKIIPRNKLHLDEHLAGKVSMKALFGRRNARKDGSLGKIITIPPIEVLQREDRKPFICYSSLDSISTLRLYESLKGKLSKMPWKMDGTYKGSMINFYEYYWRPFGEILALMETEGVLVDRDYLAEVEKVAITEQHAAAERFRNWASKYCRDARHMNVGSDTQLRQLFFGGISNRKNPDECLPVEKSFKVPNVDNIIEEGKKKATKFRSIKLHRIADTVMDTELFTASGWPSTSGAALKALAGKVSAEYDFDDICETESDDDLELSEIAELDDNSSTYGTAYAAFGKGRKGIEACHAIAALCEMCSIDSLISNFILPLQGSHVSGKHGRIHCSLNINTETGRLSARRPNLQNQPALEKDRYKIRQAFIAAPGNSLIVADYGQLELRILAHLAGCKSMMDAFKAGGDFHSRTAMNMYQYIREAVEENKVLLEWHPEPGQEKPPVPLLKDAFASERRKAKMLNFSIAYGKTPVGLSRDWKVTVKEAQNTVNLWYKERKEVLAWQQERKKEAAAKSCVHTLLGRQRRFPSMDNASPQQRGHIERAAINTPVQGSAADVAMCAMLEIVKNVRLKELGWKLLLQVHDEVILEGPTESSEEAKAIVVDCMSKPFNGKNTLNVDLVVDAKCAQNWYAANDGDEPYERHQREVTSPTKMGNVANEVPSSSQEE